MPLSEEQERQIVASILAGDHNQFACLLEEHNRRIYQFIWRRLRNTDLTTELTHESFVKAFRNLRQYRGEVRLIFWLEKIALNVVRTFVTSKRGRESQLWESLEDNDNISDQHRSPVDQASDRELLTKVRMELGKMDRRFAEVIELSVLQDRSAAEVAEILGIPEGTALSRLNRGLKTLLKRIAREVKDE